MIQHRRIIDRIYRQVKSAEDRSGTVFTAITQFEFKTVGGSFAAIMAVGNAPCVDMVLCKSTVEWHLCAINHQHAMLRSSSNAVRNLAGRIVTVVSIQVGIGNYLTGGTFIQRQHRINCQCWCIIDRLHTDHHRHRATGQATTISRLVGKAVNTRKVRIGRIAEITVRLRVQHAVRRAA